MWLTIGLLLIISFVAALSSQTTQPATPTSAEVLVLPPTGDPLTVPPIATRGTPISATSSNCNLATVPPPTGRVTNPAAVRFNDPFTAGRQCEAPIPSGLPNGNGYRATVVLVAPSCGAVAPCRAERSAVAIPSPFDVVPVMVPPTTATGVQFRE